MKKFLIKKIQKYGHVAPGFFIHVLAFLLYGKQAFKSRVHWGTRLGNTLSLSPEEALDRLARKAGISKKVIKASKLRVAAPEEILDPRFTDIGELTAEALKKLEKDIAASIKPS